MLIELEYASSSAIASTGSGTGVDMRDEARFGNMGRGGTRPAVASKEFFLETFSGDCATAGGNVDPHDCGMRCSCDTEPDLCCCLSCELILPIGDGERSCLAPK